MKNVCCDKTKWGGGGPKPTPLKKQKNKTKLIIGTPTPRTDVRHLASINRKTLDDSVVYLCQHSMSIYIRTTTRLVCSASIPKTSRTLPGQPFVLQATESVELPQQLFPPYIGVGLLQERDRVLVPPPQVTGQYPQPPQLPQPPCTEMKKRILYLCIQLSMTDRVVQNTDMY